MGTIGDKVIELRSEIQCSKLSVTPFWGNDDAPYFKPEDIIVTCMNSERKDCYRIPLFNTDNCKGCDYADGGTPIV